MKKFLVALVLVCCSSTQKPNVVTNTSCEDVCAKFKSMGCKEGNDLKGGTTCENFCRTTLQNGHDLKLDCLIKVKSCDQIKKATNSETCSL